MSDGKKGDNARNSGRRMWGLGLGLVAALVVAVGVFWVWGWCLAGTGWPPRGTAETGAWGDAFAPLVGLLTAGALIAAIVSVRLQARELAAQREELRLTREEMREQRKEMEEHRRVAEAQAKAAEALAEATARANELANEANEAADEANEAADEANVIAQMSAEVAKLQVQAMAMQALAAVARPGERTTTNEIRTTIKSVIEGLNEVGSFEDAHKGEDGGESEDASDNE